MSGSTGSMLSESARPVRRSGRKTRNLIFAAIITFVIAACAVSGYFYFGAPSHPANSNSSIPGITNILFSDPLTSNTNGWSNDSVTIDFAVQ
jgi:hypothetical protein